MKIQSMLHNAMHWLISVIMLCGNSYLSVLFSNNVICSDFLLIL